MTDRLTSLLAERPWLLADGATGSNLFERGLMSGDAPELWNSEHPDPIADLHRAFFEAGAHRPVWRVVGPLRCDTSGGTMMGLPPPELAVLHRKHHLAPCGSNCGPGPAELVACSVNPARAWAPTAILVAKANCGIPQFVD